MLLKNVLPEEILLQIFSEIDKKNLLKFLEINSEWRSLLIKNVKVMRKLPLIMMNDTWTEKIEFIEKYGKYIREVNFISTEVDSFEDIVKVLRLTPNVEKLSLIDLKIKEKIISEEMPEEEEEKIIGKAFMKNLRQITIRDEINIGSLEFIASHLIVKMTSLKCDLNDDAQRSTLEQLLTENRQLRSLEIFTSLDEIFHPSEEVVDGFQCRLERLLVKSPLLKYNDQFMRFLKSQKYLKDVGLLATHVDFRYHQMMFTTFPNVKRIQLNIDALGTSDCLLKLQKIPFNPSIESMSVFGRNLHLNIFEALLKVSPGLQELNIENMTQFYSDKIRELPLTHLRVDRAKKHFVTPDMTRQSTKVELLEVVPSQKEVYERNLHNFSDLSLFSDKSREVIEAF